MPLQKCKFLPDVYVDAVFIEMGFSFCITFTFFRHIFLHIFNLIYVYQTSGRPNPSMLYINYRSRQTLPCAFYNFGP